MKPYFKLSNDYMYKLVMSNTRIMSVFLERVLGIFLDDFLIFDKSSNKEINPIVVKEFLMQELNSSNVHVRKKNVDLLVKTKDSIIDLEYNSIFNEETIKRNFAYISNIYSNYLKKTKKFKTMPKIVQINICSNISDDFDIDNHFIIGEKYKKILIDNINIIVINVAKYKNLLYTNSESLIKKYAHIIMFDCNKQELELLSQYDSFVKEVYDMLNDFNDDENIYGYLDDEEFQKKYIEAMIDCEKDKARKIGLELGQKLGQKLGEKLGEKRGEKLGEKRGLKRGIEETKLATAKKMLKKHFSLQDIRDITGLKKDFLETIEI